MKLFRVLFMGSVILSALTVTLGSSVKSDYQKNFDFSRLRTFNFKTDRAGNDPLVNNAIESNRIQNASSTQLQMNGFTQSEDNPDFIVAFYSRTRERTQVQSFGYGPGFGWGYRVPFRNRWRWGFGPDIWTTTYIQGCVMADIIDAKTQELVGRGVVQDPVNGIGQTEKQANSAAKDLVKRFLKDTKRTNKAG